MSYRTQLILLLALGFASCAQADDPYDCARSDDCPDELCVRGECVSTLPRPADDVGVTLVDAPPVASPADDITRPVAGPCVDAIPPTPETLVVNEILVNVPPGPAGDANGDGVRDPYDDEFVELVNRSDDPIDLTGVRISNGDRLKFWFEPLCLLAGESIVVFGGGTVGSSVAGNAVVSDTRFAFGNDGGSISVTAPTGVIATIEYENSPPESLTLAPQLRGDRWVAHGTLSALPFSPGRCADGSDITTRCSEHEPEPAADMGED